MRKKTTQNLLLPDFFLMNETYFQPHTKMLLEALSSPYVYSNVLFIIAGISFPIHLFGEYCILFKTPKVMKSVKWSLFDVHLWSSLMDLFLSFFVQPLAFFPVMAEFPMGVLNRIGMKTDVLMCSGVLIALRE